ncbi:MAG: hypothetical protein P4L81_00345 [Candidatus Pacebacteria bacterium]|nr:hypothetical protein [Candidatus Paceibacterota bacterium]
MPNEPNTRISLGNSLNEFYGSIARAVINNYYLKIIERLPKHAFHGSHNGSFSVICRYCHRNRWRPSALLGSAGGFNVAYWHFISDSHCKELSQRLHCHRFARAACLKNAAFPPFSRPIGGDLEPLRPHLPNRIEYPSRRVGSVENKEENT